jgi:hypothetical protein
MKRKIKFSILLTALLVIVRNAEGVPRNDTSALSVVQNYVHSFMYSDHKELNRILSEDACLKIPRQNKVIIQNKEELVQDSKFNKGTIQNCSIEGISLIASSSSIVIAMVTFKYAKFDEYNYLIIEREEGDWKIRQVIKMFSDDQPIQGPFSLTAR